MMEKGMLVTKARDTLVVRDRAGGEVRAGLRKRLPSRAYRALHSASIRFYRVMSHRRGGLQDPLTG
ncbi:MAG TPA: hypothetical protein VF496_05640 [Candidatus Deferrimicrobium sp.]